MRTVPSALQAKLDAGVTTLAQCWKLTRRDGMVVGFTDHDVDLTFDGVTFRAGTGLSASEATSRFGLAVDGAEIAGALSDDSLSEHDLAGGRYDAATIETWLVDVTDVGLRVLTARGSLGEVRREGAAFGAELRGLADALAQESGRLYTARCGADLGDTRCRVDLASPVFRGSGAVVTVDGMSQFTASGLAGFADGWFSAGKLVWSSGANTGLAMEVKIHRNAGGVVRLVLWQAMADAILPGDGFVVTAGCDKQFSTCRNRFGNSGNFRGFPHIPGNDFVLSYPRPSAARGGRD
ncbi:MAG: DUF2163 domain-containing protein [Xanthobacteraceae bacterium]